jgi:hypothetical protein
MISVVHNEIQKGIEIFLDDAGVELLIKKLQTLKKSGHLHLYGTSDDSGLCMKSPYNNEEVFGQLILTTLPSDAWDDIK